MQAYIRSRTFSPLSPLCAALLIAFVFTVSGNAQSLTPPGVVWTHHDGGQFWIAKHVSLGNYGTQVFSHYYLNNRTAVLLSAHDADPPTPVWEVYLDPDEPWAVDSAKTTDIHVAITETETSIPSENVIKISKYSSQPMSDWVYTYPHLTEGHLRLQVSSDGQVIVAVVPNPVSGMNDALVFAPSSYVPYATHSLPAGTVRDFDLSADGTKFVIGIHTTAHILDVQTGAIVFSLDYSHSLSNVGLALSGDGSVFATGGGDGRIRIYEWTGSTYVNTFTDVTPGQGLVRAIAVSDDSTTVAYGIGYDAPSTEVHTKAIDVPGKIVTMQETVSSYGQYPNTVADVAICSDGSRFAVAQYGDEPDIVEEVRVFDKYDDTPLFTLNLPGTAHDVDISSDGKWVVAGSKAVHANTGGKGGQIDLIHLGGNDLILNGVPSLGDTVSLDLYGPPGSGAMLLLSLGLLPVPQYFPGVGTLYLDLGSTIFLTMPNIGPAGTTSLGFTVPGGAGNIGESFYFQGYVTNPGTLSETWVKLTVLP